MSDFMTILAAAFFTLVYMAMVVSVAAETRDRVHESRHGGRSAR